MNKISGADPALAKAEPVARLGPSGFDPSRIARKLTPKQFEALRLSGEGWGLSFYMPYGLHPGDRLSAVGKPYWMMKPGLVTPKAPHWRVATSLQDLGLIHQGYDAETITDLGRAVLAIATEAGTAATGNTDAVHEGAGPKDIAQKEAP